jgi:uncharacterized protein YjbI with pentapeptide repeats
MQHMENLLTRPQPSFHGNSEDLEQFLRYASSPIRNPAREKAKFEWEAYKQARQFASLKLKRPMYKGENMIALTAHVIDLRGANLDNIILGYADLRGVRFDGCSMHGAWMKAALLENASLVNADLSAAPDSRGPARLLNSDLRRANLTRANLSGVDLSSTRMENSILEHANLTDASLMGASLVGCRISGAILKNTSVYGVSAWDLEGEPAQEHDLIITSYGEDAVTVDRLRVAQFIHLLLDNPQIRSVIDTVTAKSVLILGRFTAERKPALDKLRSALRARGLVPMLFDFQPSDRRDLTETIQLLANMARFVIADLTEAKSLPQELSHIIPDLPSVPIQPILLAGQREYAMFEHWKQYRWVLPNLEYKDEQSLINDTLPRIIERVKNYEGEDPQSEIERLQARIEELKGRKP